MNELPTAFLAYPSKPERLAEIMEKASQDINDCQTAVVRPWTLLKIGGRLIIDQVCKAIDQADLLMADITYLNSNVLFELGYAIGQKKAVWILFDPSIEPSKRDFDDLGLLSTVGYAEYRSASDVLKKFFSENLFAQSTTLYEQLLGTKTAFSAGDPTLLYLKCPDATESSSRVNRHVLKSAIPPIVDDPKEISHQTFAWYAQQVTRSFAVITHLTSTERIGNRVHNAKHALVSGIAHGLGKNLLMIADDPYVSPLDYRDLMYVSKTARECESVVQKWLKDQETLYFKNTTFWDQYKKEREAKKGLQALSLGDPVAENEQTFLLDYFVPTHAYQEALNAQQTLFVGRKGTGKTANLFKLASELAGDKRNFVCVVNPLDYDLTGLVRLLSQNLDRTEAGYLIESLWKFLIYSELARSLLEYLESAPPSYPYSEEELEFMHFCNDNSEIVRTDFATRLERAVERLRVLSAVSESEQKTRISEALHSSLIPQFKGLLVRALGNRQRVVVLIDNLDKSWTTRPSKDLSSLILGLIHVSQNLAADFNFDKRVQRRMRFSLVIFLRSDIFSHLSDFANEKDKISHARLAWDDNDKLLAVIDERFKSSIENLTAGQIWEKYFAQNINGIPVKEYLLRYIIPRPRDLIYLLKESIAEATSRGHVRVEENDIMSAQKRYSEYVLDSVVSEYVGDEFDLLTVCFEFINQKPVLTLDELAKIFSLAGVPEDKHSSCLKILRNISFLGFRIDKSMYRFVSDFGESKKLEVIARRFRDDFSMPECYMVNYPFRAYLEIKDEL
jgi:hypothetical protein